VLNVRQRQTGFWLRTAEEVIRAVITRILEREGYTVPATGDLPSALEVLKNCTPDLLLTNLYMPGTTGHDAALLLTSVRPVDLEGTEENLPAPCYQRGWRSFAVGAGGMRLIPAAISTKASGNR
jgi:CheY-like chemotaxis protein